MKKRRIFERLLKQKDSKKISLIVGARQVGKTTLLKALYDEIRKDSKCLFLDLDVFSNFERVSSFDKLIGTLKLNGYSEKQKVYFYLFLDEFQEYSDMITIMKNVYDNYNNIKIYASGSSSLTIKSQAQESLAGRKKINYLYPLDFEEFLWFKEEALEEFSNVKKLKGKELKKIAHKLSVLLDEFIVFGSYPEVVLQEKEKDKIEVLESIFDLYVKKDLVEYLKVEKILEVKKLIEHLAVNNGQKIKYEELSQICSLDFKSVINYIEVLKETGIVHIHKPFFTNKNKELVKIPKIYFIDNGVRNYFINNFNKPRIRDDRGFLLEGYVISELIKLGFSSLKFWQDKNKHEVDIVIDLVHNQVPLEIKNKETLKADDFTGLKAFLKSYPNVKKGYLINTGLQEKGKITTLLPYDIKTVIPK